MSAFQLLRCLSLITRIAFLDARCFTAKITQVIKLCTTNLAAADYVYVMEFDGDRIRHMTKIWNDAISLKQLGWA